MFSTFGDTVYCYWHQKILNLSRVRDRKLRVQDVWKAEPAEGDFVESLERWGMSPALGDPKYIAEYLRWMESNGSRPKLSEMMG